MNSLKEKSKFRLALATIATYIMLYLNQCSKKVEQAVLFVVPISFIYNRRGMMNYKEMLIAFFLYLISIWIGGYINSALGISAGGDLLRTLAFSFIPFAVFWIVWKKFGPKAEHVIG